MRKTIMVQSIYKLVASHVKMQVINFSYVSSDTSGVFEYVKTDKCGIVDVSDTRDMPKGY